MKEISRVLIQREKEPQMVIRFQLAFLLKWTKMKMNEKIEKKCEICRQHGHNRTETIVSTYLHLKFFLSQM